MIEIYKVAICRQVIENEGGKSWSFVGEFERIEVDRYGTELDFDIELFFTFTGEADDIIDLNFSIVDPRGDEVSAAENYKPEVEIGDKMVFLLTARFDHIVFVEGGPHRVVVFNGDHILSDTPFEVGLKPDVM